MKTKLISSISLIVLSSISALAQDKPATTTTTDGVPVVALGTIVPPVTSREKVLAYPRLLPQSLSCEVTGFEFSMTANGKTWGPVTVKGAVFNEDVKNKIKDTEPDNVKISITNIRVKCSGLEMTANPINLEYNH